MDYGSSSAFSLIYVKFFPPDYYFWVLFCFLFLTAHELFIFQMFFKKLR